MTVYVDDAAIPATVPNGRVRHTSQWSHLTADTQDELHAFAERLGLRRSYFQPGRPLGGKPSPFWHYDVTAGKRQQALALGAQPVPARELPALCRERDARASAVAEHRAASGQRRRPARPGLTLDRQCRERLAAAGITADDPGLQQIARHNAALGIHPQIQPEREAEG